MKKLMFSAALLMSSLTISYGGEGDKIRLVKNDTSNATVVFNIRQIDQQKLSAFVDGVTSDMASISLMNCKGETLRFAFVDQERKQYELDLSDLETGRYYVKLNMDSEIRMKLVVVEKQ
ncbi:MAG: hypothetical protein ACQERC_12185 [Bacteroidota bacterium]